MPDIYQTIASVSEGIYKEKGSKFIAYAHPLNDENAVKEIVAVYKKKYFDARHHCYAWQIGVDGSQFRENDDGEPSGTAGKPIHGQIRSAGLTNILVVVVRYFGGIKLGTSGLIYAYKEATADAIANATIVTRTVDDYYRLNFGYIAMNDVMRVFKEEEAHIINQDFNMACSIDFHVRQSLTDRVVSRLEKIDSASVEFVMTK
ncbi:putative YigZ family protein [Breznakibacter xylanolyticus]|uniref:Putative YigZ family protein n=1 Tax=Breznakibacter xylanolyticus TaxID=990 RepID=A0A2W7N0D5_9BACT|nr:YigZ family protein [Breznakibacter xylanolyticus]PZX13530.1 putative YigZ family protein [Breznakibacter xylanolyticus]